MATKSEKSELSPTAILEDPIIVEVRAAREALFAAAGYDLVEYGRLLRARQANSGHPVISRPPRPAGDETAA